jgi:hypothetical protein
MVLRFVVDVHTTWPSSGVYDILLFIPEGICFAARKPNKHTRIWKLTETQQKQTQIRNCII